MKKIVLRKSYKLACSLNSSFLFQLNLVNSPTGNSIKHFGADFKVFLRSNCICMITLSDSQYLIHSDYFQMRSGGAIFSN